MVRKVSALACVLALIFAFGMTAQAAEYTPYDGNPSTTYITYFKDIVSGIGFKDNYVAFRNGQNEYIMIVGQLEYNNGVFTLVGQGESYRMYQEGTYNSNYVYEYNDNITNVSVRTNNRLIYSDIGNYPQLVERGAKYEILTAVLVCIALLGVVIGRIFRKR